MSSKPSSKARGTRSGNQYNSDQAGGLNMKSKPSSKNLGIPSGNQAGGSYAQVGITDLEAASTIPTRERVLEPMQVSSQDTATNLSTSGPIDENDFCICCLAQALCGFIGSGLVLVCNYREGYPTASAW
eukprot:CAMPEP_0168821388 /NCGR_PEP_ID=MMETSP0726-20121227/9374_1 /TAXON_ID=265536 /ORGANISM="Amphiprora sp., Strain CCMP467" /LENGTH=128 /DNA_ID=CAMNT_0008873999 /DNA_START=19 /DNA_END=402 /DNA_ORIENTATION=+